MAIWIVVLLVGLIYTPVLLGLCAGAISFGWDYGKKTSNKEEV